jgi:hypothetical protein
MRLIPLRLVFLPFLTTLLALLTGCVSGPRANEVPALAVTLADVRLLETTAFETRLSVTLRLTNQTPHELTFSGDRHLLVLNGRSIGAAVGAEPLALPALTSVTREVTLNASHLALLGLIRQLQREPTVRYELDSTLFVPGVFARDIRASHSGVIDLSSLAQGTPASR